MMNILNRLQEAIERGLWDATDEYKDKLKELYIETEARIEEITDR
jgi:cobaltochelatase CobN